MFIFPLLTKMCYKQNYYLNKILDDWHCNGFNSVDSYNNCIHVNNKNFA